LFTPLHVSIRGAKTSSHESRILSSVDHAQFNLIFNTFSLFNDGKSFSAGALRPTELKIGLHKIRWRPGLRAGPRQPIAKFCGMRKKGEKGGKWKENRFRSFTNFGMSEKEANVEDILSPSLCTVLLLLSHSTNTEQESDLCSGVVTVEGGEGG